MSGLSEEQLLYLKDVLGLDSVVLGKVAPRAQPAQAPAPVAAESRVSGNPAQAKLLVLAAGARDYVLEGEAGELAAKMIQAMKLGSNEVVIAEWIGNATEEVRDIWSEWKGFVLSFGDLAAQQLAGRAHPGEFMQDGEREVMVTDSPARLLSEPARKKVAWAHLQQIMKRF